MRKHSSSVFIWLLLFLACFHAAASASHHAHCSGPGGAIPGVAHMATEEEAPGDSAPAAAHTVCTACVLQAHGALPAAPVPAAWEPAVSPAAALPWTALEDPAHRGPWRSRFAARDPPTAG